MRREVGSDGGRARLSSHHRWEQRKGEEGGEKKEAAEKLRATIFINER